MKKSSLAKLNTAELRSIHEEAGQILQAREEAERKRIEKREQLKRTLEEAGLTMDDLCDLAEEETSKRRGTAGNRKTGTVEQKYANPANSSQTWSGRGRKPVWARDYVDNGGSLDDLLIAS